MTIEKRDRSIEDLMESTDTDELIRQAGLDPSDVDFDKLNQLMMREHIKRIYQEYFKKCKAMGRNPLEYGDDQVHIAADELCKVAALMYATSGLNELGDFLWHVIKVCPEQLEQVFHGATEKLTTLVSMHIRYLEGEVEPIQGHSPFNYFVNKMKEYGLIEMGAISTDELPSEAVEAMRKARKS